MIWALSGSHKLPVLALWPIISARVMKEFIYPWITVYLLLILPVNSHASCLGSFLFCLIDNFEEHFKWRQMIIRSSLHLSVKGWYRRSNFDGRRHSHSKSTTGYKDCYWQVWNNWLAYYLNIISRLPGANGLCYCTVLCLFISHPLEANDYVFAAYFIFSRPRRKQ